MARKRGAPTTKIQFFPADDPRLIILEIYKGKAVFWLWAILILFIGIYMGSHAVDQWNDFLKFIHASSFGIQEPIFDKDAGFYIFKLPVYQFITGWYFFMVVLTFIAVVSFLLSR